MTLFSLTVPLLVLPSYFPAPKQADVDSDQKRFVFILDLPTAQQLLRVKPGDRVDIIVPQETENGPRRLSPILRNIPVVSIETAENANARRPRILNIGLGVTPTEAKLLTEAANTGRLRISTRVNPDEDGLRRIPR